MQPENRFSSSSWGDKSSNGTRPSNTTASNPSRLVQQLPSSSTFQHHESAGIAGEKRPRGRPKGSKDTQPRKKKMNKSDKDSDDNTTDILPARRRGRPIGSKDSHPRRRKRAVTGLNDEDCYPEAPSSSDQITMSLDSHSSNASMKKSGISSSETSTGDSMSISSEARSHPLSSADLIQSLSKELSRSLGNPPPVTSLPTTTPMFSLAGGNLVQGSVASCSLRPQLLTSISPASSGLPVSAGFFRPGLLDMQAGLSCMPILLPPTGILSQLPLQAGNLSSIISSRPMESTSLHPRMNKTDISSLLAGSNDDKRKSSSSLHVLDGPMHRHFANSSDLVLPSVSKDAELNQVEFQFAKS